MIYWKWIVAKNKIGKRKQNKVINIFSLSDILYVVLLRILLVLCHNMIFVKYAIFSKENKIAIFETELFIFI